MTATKILNHMMTMMDVNGDGAVSTTEHEAATQEMFMNADVNDDGYLTKQEMSDYGIKMRKAAGVPRYSEPTVKSNPRPHKN